MDQVEDGLEGLGDVGDLGEDWAEEVREEGTDVELDVLEADVGGAHPGVGVRKPIEPELGQQPGERRVAAKAGD